MARNRKMVGAAGEALAAQFLEGRGYQIIDANVRPEGGPARGELDLIAWDGNCLVFVEVKTRRVLQGAQGTPAEAVDARKRRQLLSLAAAYLAHHQLDEIACRFDVVEVIEGAGGFANIRVLPNAFDASDESTTWY